MHALDFNQTFGIISFSWKYSLGPMYLMKHDCVLNTLSAESWQPVLSNGCRGSCGWCLAHLHSTKDTRPPWSTHVSTRRLSHPPWCREQPLPLPLWHFWNMLSQRKPQKANMILTTGGNTNCFRCFRVKLNQSCIFAFFFSFSLSEVFSKCPVNGTLESYFTRTVTGKIKE